MTAPMWRIRRVDGPTLAVAAALVGLTVVISLVRPLSFDEAYWLTLSRRIFGAGDLPYLDLLDNKGPLLYAAIAAADLLPGMPRWFMSILLAIVVAGLFFGARRLAEIRGQQGPWPRVSAVITAFAAVSLSVWAITTELLVSTVIVWGFAARNPWVRLGLCLAASLVDPRAVLLAGVVLYDGYRHTEMSTRHVGVFAGLAGAAATAVLANQDLRFAFVETALATRFGAHWADLVVLTVAALTPVVVVMALLRVVTYPATAMATLVFGLVVGLSAGLPYGHYWVYALLVIPLLPITRSRLSARLTTILLIGAVVTVGLVTQDHWRADVAAASRFDGEGADLAALIEADDRVLIWSPAPYHHYRIGPLTIGFAPTSNYFAWGLPHPERLLARWERDLARATVVVVHPALDDFRGVAEVEAALTRVAERAQRAACSKVIGELVVYRFTGC